MHEGKKKSGEETGFRGLGSKKEGTKKKLKEEGGEAFEGFSPEERKP